MTPRQEKALVGWEAITSKLLSELPGPTHLPMIPKTLDRRLQKLEARSGGPSLEVKLANLTSLRR